ncbi:MAG: AAA family ATPase [Eubacterium sp.]|nr:AAA family ATPase [Eubacterium sp.]
MKKNVAVGIQDYAVLRENDYFYIDKTAFIHEWWSSGDAVTLITRPRRFGKTLNMSMLDYFFSVDHADREDLFEGMAVWKNEYFRSLHLSNSGRTLYFSQSFW